MVKYSSNDFGLRGHERSCKEREERSPADGDRRPVLKKLGGAIIKSLSNDRKHKGNSCSNVI